MTSVVLVAAVLAAPPNLLRNGSFEGGLAYWHERDGKVAPAGGAAHGSRFLRIDSGGVQSAAFELPAGKPVTVAFSVRSSRDECTFGVQCSPCSREVGVNNGLTWSMRAKRPFKAGKAWRRHSFRFTHTLPLDGFWNRPTYMLQIGDGEAPLDVDAVTVTEGPDPGGYVPWRAAEVFAECRNLPGYATRGNLFEHGRPVRLAAHAHNPSASQRRLTLRWRWADYEGHDLPGPPAEETVEVPAEGTVTWEKTLTLQPRGFVLGRVQLANGDKVLDQSDVPVCSLPYPKDATTPDFRERFGGSFFGPVSARLGGRLGFSWSRWHPHMNWSDHQKDGPDRWRWFDKELDYLEGLGISSHAVLYDRPAWAFDGTDSPLPKDMRWPADDARWDDLTLDTAWDRFVRGAAAHYKGRSLVYEIENEPEFNKWDPAVYARFTIRTARQIKRTDPAAKVMVDNVYGIPSGLNRRFLEAGGVKHIDVVSWHDYHAAGLADATALRRMRQALDDLGGKHVQIWFNEGWAYTNTASDEPAVALTGLTAARSTNLQLASVAELTAVGQDKTVLFHTGYEHHGMSFWDYAGPGTMLWDFDSNPLPLVAGWSVLSHHVGLSERAGFVRPPNCNAAIFDDLRNRRGVVVLYADADAPGDATLSLPVAPGEARADDLMGHPFPLAATTVDGRPGLTVTLPKSGRVVFLWADDRRPGAAWRKLLEPLDRKNARFMTGATDGRQTFALPLSWEGRRGTHHNNPLVSGGRPVWRLDQVYPDDPTVAVNYKPMPWNGVEWQPAAHTFGGQPAVKVENGTFRAAIRAPWSGPGNDHQSIAAAVFVAPKTGRYEVSGVALSRPWEGGAPALAFGVFKKDTQRAAPLLRFDLPRDKPVPFTLTAELTAGDELTFVPLAPHWHNAANVSVQKLAVTFAGR